MPPHHPPPTNHTIFDPWNSSATGHQRAENPYSKTTSWRETRRAKLATQFAATATATAETDAAKTAGRGGEWKWVSAPEAQRHQLGCRDIRTMMGATSIKKRGFSAGDGHADGDEDAGKKGKGKILCETPTSTPTSTGLETETETEAESKPDNENEGGNEAGKKILAGTTIYINGSTMPLISDHRLKYLLVSHGAQLAISLARRSVTHVIVGRPNAGPGAGAGAGAGGGLAAGKLQREIVRGGWKGVRVVGVEWALESIKAEKRLSEARFAMEMAPGGQRSVLGMLRRG